MRLGIRGKLLALSLVVLTTGLLGAHASISAALERDIDQRARAELGVRADIVAAAASSAADFAPSTLERVVRAQAVATRSRVTVVAPDGRVVADSAVPGERLGQLENHGDRPEIRDARRTGAGFSQRDSRTVHQSLAYLARRVDGPGGPWVVRLAVAPERFEAAYQTVRRWLVLGGVLGLVVAAALSSLAVQLFSRPARELTRAAHAMRTDLSVRTRLRADDELGELARALDELAEGLAQSLRARELERDRLGAILEAMAEGVLVTDEQGLVVVANRAMREMFLVGREVVGRTPLDAIRSAHLHDLIELGARTHERATTEFDMGEPNARRVIARVAPVEHAGASVVVVLSDVTELRRLETVRRDFVANVSHELRTPIAAVRAAAETLSDGALRRPDDAAEFVSIIERHAARLHRLVEDLLQLSRIEARQVDLEPEVASVDVGALLTGVVTLLRSSAEHKKVSLHVDVPPSLPKVSTSARGLDSIVFNLLDNAIKYSRDGGEVRVTADAKSGSIELAVRDNGPGIAPRHLSRIFERFYRVDTGRSRELGGTGLGLAIVKNLAEALGGSVSVQSEVGRGSVFTVVIPDRA